MNVKPVSETSANTETRFCQPSIQEISPKPYSSAKDGTVVIIPAYNEERFIGSMVLQAREYADTVIVVDDGSGDATSRIAEAAGAVVVRLAQNQGKGAALNAGFYKAYELGANVVALLDGDGQHKPVDIPRMTRPVIEGEADMVIGSRYLQVKSNIPLYRRLGQCIITFLTNSCSGVSSTDSWSGFRAFSQKAIEKIRFREGGWGVDPEFQFLACEHGFKILEVPIEALYEEKAKRNPIPHGLKTVNAILRLTGQHRPLLFFSAAGSTVLTLGLVVGLWVVNGFNVSGQLAVGMALLSALLCIIGTLSLSTGVILHSVRGLLLEFLQSGARDG